jgi:hypothetical protein
LKGDFVDAEKKSIEKRQRVQHLYFVLEFSTNEIVAELNVSKGFVVDWTQDKNRDPFEDRRGWPRGKGRKFSVKSVKRVRQLHSALCKDPKEFFHGASAIRMTWQRRYPAEEVPSIRQIGTILKAEGLAAKPKRSSKGAAKYLCYPETTLYTGISKRLLEADFIGQKFMRGHTAPLNFVGFSFKKEPRLRWYQRIENQTADVLLEQCARFFSEFETPDAIKIDNALAMSGSRSGKRSLSKFMFEMLRQQITPIFAVPRKPFSQASIEGNNSVFSRAFWNRHEFTSEPEIDEHLGWFNKSSEQYCQYQRPTKARRRQRSWLPRIYFVRQVQSDENKKRGTISIMNENISVDPALINYFVLTEWQPTNKTLLIWIEKESKAEHIVSVPFEQNINAKYKL